MPLTLAMFLHLNADKSTFILVLVMMTSGHLPNSLQMANSSLPVCENNATHFLFFILPGEVEMWLIDNLSKHCTVVEHILLLIFIEICFNEFVQLL